MSNRFMRNKDLIDQKKLVYPISVIGAGGIGSALVTLMGIMGFKDIRLWDPDSLEEHNRSSTLYPKEWVGEQKPIAALHTFRQYADDNQKLHPICRRFPHPEAVLEDIVFLGTDSMKSREGVYHKWVSNPDRKLLVDMRMGALGMEVVTVTRNNDYFWESFISDADAPEQVCTMKHTIFSANVVAGLGLTQAFSFLQNIPYYAYINLSLTPINLHKKHLIMEE